MDLKIGEKFNFKGFEWVVLDEHDFNGEKAVTAIMTKAWATAPFDEDNRNDWRTSSIRKKLQEELLPVLGEENLITRSLELVADNGDQRYGRCDDKIWLLSCDDYRKYRETILKNCDFEDDWWWTLTPWWIDEDGYGYSVRYILPSGSVGIYNAVSSHGVAPACIFHLASLASAPSVADLIIQLTSGKGQTVRSKKMRLIDADVLKQHIDKLPALPDGNFAGNHSALKALINMQPTIEPSTNCSEIPNNWIPCSERLPEEDNWLGGSGKQFSDSVLMTVLNTIDDEKIIDYGHTTDGEWYSERTECYIPHGWEVIAWMPLPEPWRGDSICK